MKLKKAKNDIYLYLFMIVLSLLVYFWIIPTQVQMNAMAKAETFSPDTFPRFVTMIWIIISVVGALWALRTYFQIKNEDGTECIAEKNKRTKKEMISNLIPYIFFVLAVVYGILFHMIGFIPSTIIMLPIMLFVIGCKKWSYYVIVYAFVALLYVLFRVVLHVPIY